MRIGMSRTSVNAWVTNYSEAVCLSLGSRSNVSDSQRIGRLHGNPGEKRDISRKVVRSI